MTNVRCQKFRLFPASLRIT